MFFFYEDENSFKFRPLDLRIYMNLWITRNLCRMFYLKKLIFSVNIIKSLKLHLTEIKFVHGTE